ncbi:MAG TPA: hypothetical protein P5531_10170 [Bacteroidales bacterium]|nr:hypothetical protein [Bacteroidales bacterium]HSA44004.1 hypothetical protein [Bacteroidales bacterium]
MRLKIIPVNLRKNIQFAGLICKQMIIRNLTARIISSLENFPAVAILGPRQVSKTTLAKSLKNDLPHESLYLDLENPLDVSVLSAPLVRKRTT